MNYCSTFSSASNRGRCTVSAQCTVLCSRLVFARCRMCSRVTAGFDSCEIDGSARLNHTGEHIYNKSQYQLLQVCLFGHWSYVCSNSGFGNSIRGTRNMNVTLYQLGCVNGGLISSIVMDIHIKFFFF